MRSSGPRTMAIPHADWHLRQQRVGRLRLVVRVLPLVVLLAAAISFSARSPVERAQPFVLVARSAEQVSQQPIPAGSGEMTQRLASNRGDGRSEPEISGAARWVGLDQERSAGTASVDLVESPIPDRAAPPGTWTDEDALALAPATAADAFEAAAVLPETEVLRLHVPYRAQLDDSLWA